MSGVSEPDVDTDAEEETSFWLFEIDVNGTLAARVFGVREKRNWVLWKVSQYVVAFTERGAVTVRQRTNGEWREADDWRNLAH